ncbi:MAG: hypothetical protein IPN96_16500 [Anaerolineales bacterium]|nr:hypothetical protein [Anaerolineales bacterium]
MVLRPEIPVEDAADGIVSAAEICNGDQPGLTLVRAVRFRSRFGEMIVKLTGFSGQTRLANR